MPVDKQSGDEVIGATINREGLLKIKATRVGADTTLAQIIRLVDMAQTSKAPIQRFADRAASYFVPGVVAAALLTFAAWTFWGYRQMMSSCVRSLYSSLPVRARWGWRRQPQ